MAGHRSARHQGTGQWLTSKHVWKVIVEQRETLARSLEAAKAYDLRVKMSGAESISSAETSWQAIEDELSYTVERWGLMLMHTGVDLMLRSMPEVMMSQKGWTSHFLTSPGRSQSVARYR